MAWLARRAWLALLCAALLSPGCVCYGGGNPPPEDDDDEEDDDGDDDGTEAPDPPEYDLSGFYLDLGWEDGSGGYEGLAVLENGSLLTWTGDAGAHAEEEWLATLSRYQLDLLVRSLGPETFFQASIDEGGDCVLEFRLGTASGVAEHPGGDVPGLLGGFYATLGEILQPFDVDHACD